MKGHQSNAHHVIIHDLHVTPVYSYNPRLQMWFAARVKIFGETQGEEGSMITAGDEKRYYQSYGVCCTFNVL